MKVIDLLNKIANGEEMPKKIKFGCREYTYTDDGTFLTYFDEENHALFKCYTLDTDRLNDEVEIIEEDKKIEKLDDNFSYRLKMKDILWNDNELIMVKKINEIIDYINKENE